MPSINPHHDPAPPYPVAPRKKRVWVSALMFLSFCAVGTALFLTAQDRIERITLGPLSTQGAPIRVSSDAFDRVYLLTGQTQTFFRFGRSAMNTRQLPSDLLIDLWALDAATLSPVWRKRLDRITGGAAYERGLLGAQGNTLWLNNLGRLYAFSLEDGRMLASPETLEAKNPQLKGLMPTESRYYRLDEGGLVLTAADAREWRLDGETLKAQPAAEPAREDAAEVVPVPYWVPMSSYSFMERAVPLQGRWLGMLTDEEAERFAKNKAIGGIDWEARMRLWSATKVEDDSNIGPYENVKDFQPLPKSPEFLSAGLLAIHRSTGKNDPLWLQNPDSVLVLHHDRLGEDRKLLLSRVAGPEGAVVWEARLPLSILQSMMNGEGHVVLMGREYPPSDPKSIGDPFHAARELLISVDLATGHFITRDHQNPHVEVPFETLENMN